MVIGRDIKIKICCISSVQEAQMAIECGADILGLVGPMPSGPGIISNQLISQISAFCPPHIKTFLLTSETTADNIIAHHKLVNTTSIQIVDHISEREYEKIKREIPDVELIQVVHVIDDSSINYAKMISQYADAILLDSGKPDADVKILGGTGQTHNWEISQQIISNIDKKVFLAGGLNANNVVKAIATVRPSGIDLCSGVRTSGMLDFTKLQKFILNVRSFDG